MSTKRNLTEAEQTELETSEKMLKALSEEQLRSSFGPSCYLAYEIGYLQERIAELKYGEKSERN